MRPRPCHAGRGSTATRDAAVLATPPLLASRARRGTGGVGARCPYTCVRGRVRSCRSRLVGRGRHVLKRGTPSRTPNKEARGRGSQKCTFQARGGVRETGGGAPLDGGQAAGDTAYTAYVAWWGKGPSCARFTCTRWRPLSLWRTRVSQVLYLVHIRIVSRVPP